MTLPPDCYTETCHRGKWFHHEHGTQTAYMLKGGCPVLFDLAHIPHTEDELSQCLDELDF